MHHSTSSAAACTRYVENVQPMTDAGLPRLAPPGAGLPPSMVSAAERARNRHQALKRAVQDERAALYRETFGRGAESTNRPPANRQEGDHETGGEDTLTVSLWVDWGEGAYHWFEVLDDLKASAQEHNAPQRHEYGGGCYYVESTGTRTEGGRAYRWRLDCQGFRMSMSNHAEPLKSFPNVVVTVGSLELMAAGLQAVWADVVDWIEGMGGRIVDERLSRVDPCVDLPGLSLLAFVRPWVEGRVVTRARSSREWTAGLYKSGRKFTGLTVGSGRILCRIYDKLEEVRKKQDDAKRAVLIERRWGGVEPESAVRVEWQLRGEALRTFGVATVADWIQRREGVLDYLMNQWLRFTDAVVDEKNGHQARAVAAAVWQQVAEAFKQWSSSSVKSLERLKKPVVYCAKALQRQAVGCLTSIIAAARQQVECADDLVVLVSDQIWALLQTEWDRVSHKLDIKRRIVDGKVTPSVVADASCGGC